MDHASKYTLGLLARVSRQQLLRNKDYVIEKFGVETWNVLLKLNVSNFIHLINRPEPHGSGLFLCLEFGSF